MLPNAHLPLFALPQSSLQRMLADFSADRGGAAGRIARNTARSGAGGGLPDPVAQDVQEVRVFKGCRPRNTPASRL